MTEIIRTDSELMEQQEEKLNPTTQIVPANPMSMLKTALDKGASIETIEKFMNLAERFEKNESRKAYVKAMAEFKATAPQLKKDCEVKYGQTQYKHESLGYICDVLIPQMGEFGLSHRWDFSQKDGQITVTTVITHELGHSESTPLTSESDKTGGKNSIQAIGSTVKYLERYTFLGAVGMASSEHDDDGREAIPIKYITADQVEIIDNLINVADKDKDKFLKWCKSESVETILADKYNQVIVGLNK